MSKSLIRCRIRKKNVALTPEEGVRQRILQYLIAGMAYPAGLIAVEIMVRINNMAKRADIIVHDQHGAPWMIVECKRPTESLGERTLAQIAMYNNSLGAPYLLVSNGEENHILHIDSEEKKVTKLKELPTYPEI